MREEMLSAAPSAAPVDERPTDTVAAEPVMVLRDVRKSYGSGESAVEALKGIDFELPPNCMTAIVGPSGSGKSTLLNLLGALDVPSSGHVLFGAQDLAAMSEAERTRFRARHIGFVFQFLNLLPGLTCEQNVMLGGVIVGMGPAEARRRAGELLDLVGLADKRRRPARKLSGGQMQRVAIARALINDPPLLLADEPTGNLDEKNAEEITALLHERATDGRAVVLVTHNGDLAEKYADRVMVVRDGQIGAHPVAELHEISAPTEDFTPPTADAAPAARSVATPALPPTPVQQPAAPSVRPAAPPMRVAIDPTAPPDRLIADIALALARQGAAVRLHWTADGRIEIELEPS